MKPWIVGAVCGILFVGAGAQEGIPRYRPTGGEVEYVSTNDYMLWFVRGADTLGEPVSTRTQERHRYEGDGDFLKAQVTLRGLDTPFERNQVFTIDRTGRVLEVDGVAVGEAENARVDLLPRLPLDGRLEVGRTWTDSVFSSESKDYGETRYEARRTYTVVGPSEVNGEAGLLMVSTGTIALRQGGWQDPTQGVFWWQEVEGPVVDSVWFDVNSGRLLRDVTKMDLSGIGGFGNGEQEMRMPSGLRSGVVRQID